LLAQRHREVPVTKTTKKEHIWSLYIYVLAIYKYDDKFNTWAAYVDALTSAIFFVGMWLMAKKNWKTGFIGL